MALKKRHIDALDLLAQISQKEIDALAAALAPLKERERKILKKLSELEDRRSQESYSESVEAQFFVADFLKSTSTQILALSRRLEEQKRCCAEIEAKMKDAYIVLKQRQEACSRAKRDLEIESNRQMIAEMDEIAVQRYQSNARL